MQHRKSIRLADKFRIEVEVIIQTTVGFRLVDSTRHQYIGRVMIAFRFHEAAVKSSQFRINRWQFAREHLKLFATAPLDQRKAEQVIDRLMSLAVSYRTHQPTDILAGDGLAKRNPSLLQQIEHQIEMLKLLDR